MSLLHIGTHEFFFCGYTKEIIQSSATRKRLKTHFCFPGFYLPEQKCYGLPRAFKMTGVKNLVMSLWKIPDQTTAEFMQQFYKGIFDKKNINDAFYNAQTIMKNRYRKEPYKWAAWILVR